MLGIGIAVEDIADRELAGLDGQARDVDLAGELVRSARQLLLLAAEAEGLAHIEARRVVVRIGEVGFLRFAAWKSRDADRIAQAEALQQFGIVIEFAAVPEPRIQIEAVAPGRLRLPCWRQAVFAGVGRAERRIALRQIGGLAVDLPAVGFGIGDIRLRCQARRAGPVDLAIETDAHRLEVEAGGIRRARWQHDIGPAELAVEVFEPRGPVRGEGIFEARAGGPAGTDMDDLFFFAERCRVDEALADIGETAGHISEPWAARIAEAAPHGADIVPTFLDRRARGRDRQDDVVRGQIIRKGQISFDAEQQP